ncbi:hypothetical protein BDF22DRAFT_696900 [Syncephalis plumigaleata]|nr:hypothetical protein BDF22DRAFT_696900 [Syncephalis plumigaleata]
MMKHNSDLTEAVNVESLYTLLAHLDDLTTNGATSPVTPLSPATPVGGAGQTQVHVAQLLRAYCAGTDVTGLPTEPASIVETIRRIGEQCRGQPSYHAMVDRVCEAYPTLRRIHKAFLDGGPKDAVHWPGFLQTLPRVSDDCRFRVWRVVLEAGMIADLGVSRRQLDALHEALGCDDRVHYSTLHALRSAYERQLSWPDVMHAVGGLVRNGGGVANVLRDMGTRVRNVYGGPMDTLTRSEPNYDNNTNMYEIEDDDIMELERNANSYEEMLDAMEHGDDDYGYDDEHTHSSHRFYADSEGDHSFNHDSYGQQNYYDPDEYMYGGSQDGSPMIDRNEPDTALLTALGPPVVVSDPYIARVNTPEEQALSVMMHELALDESSTTTTTTTTTSETIMSRNTNNY